MNDETQDSQSSCTGNNCCCGPNRREVLKAAAASALLAASGGLPIMAGPFAASDFEKLVPADKKLSPEWLKLLFERGQRTVYRGADLEKIGMPIGGICAGQVYLGGDGRLWHWDIFNRHVGTGAEHYANPMRPAAPFEQGFALMLTAGGRTETRRLDRSGWRDISFMGEYPIGYVEYRDADCPVTVSLEAFSPFIPLNTEDSALPVTVMRFTIANTGNDAVEAELAGWLENPVCIHGASRHTGLRHNRIIRRNRAAILECSADERVQTEPSSRPDIVFEDFEKETYEGWTATGTAFGPGPIEKAKMPAYQGDVGSAGKRLVNTHNVRQGENVGTGDAHVGTLTSKPFTIEHNHINFLIGGGSHKDRTCINLLIDGKVVASATGASDNRMQPKGWDVRRWAGKTAQLQIVDNEKGPWGNIGIDQIVFSDKPAVSTGPLTAEADFGTMALALLDSEAVDRAIPALPEPAVPQSVFSNTPAAPEATADRPFGQKLLGSLSRNVKLAKGESASVTFLVVWHFPNLKIEERFKLTGRHYASRFDSATAVAEYVSKNFQSLADQTRLWHDTWYDSTLPRWFLDRTFLNTSILATSTCYWLGNGRFYGWEGVGCCPGTCGHVWHYAHAVGRLFPSLERNLREMVDFGLAQRADGAIMFRGEYNNFPAVDGQAGSILRAYREHQVSGDSAFLKRIWPKVRLAVQFLIRQDGDGNGIIEGGQHNTLDTDWFGPVAWLSSLYLAALQAGEAMAREMGDDAFATQCRQIVDRGRKSIVDQLFNGEYFINKPDPKRADTINSGTGCHIDQVFGQSWVFQVGLDRVLPEKETLAALHSLWRYSFTPDVGPYRNANKPGRWYAMSGEGGLIMCTFPKSDWNYQNAKGKGPDWAAGYFNECMTGFEYQVAGHMIWEGMLQEGLAIVRMIHDRYHPSRRNPWNEVECGDHYARAMASYGVFLAACGFEYHGPNRHIGFAPRIGAEDFRCAFTASDGWGTFSQERRNGELHASVNLKWGTLPLKTLTLAVPPNGRAGKVTITLDGAAIPANHVVENGRVAITLAQETALRAGQKMAIAIT